ncbi:hypothetical protein DA519_21255 [Salmonella enterica]|nr:hypothetical protein [Salmonella enterica]EDU7228245.1 hypothetical protein [Salmonella enterica subsp. enterica serovar Cotham]EDW6396490.1 hypothetical protein [Salmonella enterica subsp. enterica]EGM1709348.1 hypothetical protein [Salmonella enterica subsp. enterica serovar Takoradi]EBA2048746.1 hypothetical protein [Salmonella enterica]
MNNNDIISICIHKVLHGDGALPCHLYAINTSDTIYFKTMLGLDFEDVTEAMQLLFDDAHHIEYNPLTGNGRYTSIDFTPEVGLYSFKKIQK